MKPVYRNTSELLADTRVLTSQEIEVFSWSPDTVEKNTPSTEVHIVARVFKLPGAAFIVRLKSRKTCEELIAALQAHMADVWPGEKGK